MKVGTQKAALAAAAEHLAVEVSMREENLYEAFRVITTTNGKKYTQFLWRSTQSHISLSRIRIVHDLMCALLAVGPTMDLMRRER